MTRSAGPMAVAAPESTTRTRAPRRRRMSAAVRPSAPLLPVPGHHHDPPPVRAPEQVKGGNGDGVAGPAHEDVEGHRLEAATVHLLHLRHGEDRLHAKPAAYPLRPLTGLPSGPSEPSEPSASTTAMATRSMWLRERCQRWTPADEARAAALPRRQRPGGRSAPSTTSTSWRATPPRPTPRAFQVASLAANRVERRDTGSAARWAHSRSAAVKSALFEPRPAGQHPLEPLRIHGVHPDADHRAAYGAGHAPEGRPAGRGRPRRARRLGHSTVTTLARLRGRSTSWPSSRASE